MLLRCHVRLIKNYYRKEFSIRFEQKLKRLCTPLQLVREKGTMKRQMKEFYLAVHPDFFNEHPEEKNVNEESLKLLHAYIQGIEHGRPIHATSLTFYRKQETQANCYPVLLKLASKTINDVYRQILNAFEFPYDGSKMVESFDDQEVKDFQNIGHMDLGDFQKEIQVQTLHEWLIENIETATTKQKESEAIRLNILETVEKLREKHGIQQILHDFKFTYASINSVMKLFETFLKREAKSISYLRGRRILLGSFTGLDHNGRFVLDFYSVPEIWRRGFQELPIASDALRDLKNVRKKLSEQCFGVQFIDTRSTSPLPVIPYYQSLVYILQNLETDYFVTSCRYKKLNAIPGWYDTCIGISEEGYLIVPPDVTKKSLYNYLLKNYYSIKGKRASYLKNIKLEQDYLSKTKSHLNLSSLQKDTLVNTEQLQTACERILQCGDLMGLDGMHVAISSYYSVSTDGFIRIPWNFV